MKSVLNKSLRIFLGVVGIIGIAFSLLYTNIPVYEFNDPMAFEGEKWYNPYKNMEPTNWKKYNFQVQSAAWLGITDGRDNSNERIDSVYQLLGYDHVATSDYQKINTYGSHKSSFIPTYEHGYNLGRIHQVCIGAEKVFWTDFIFWQNQHAKQWVLDNLQRHSELVAIAHPRNDGSYSLDDMSHLTNYHLMEVLNNIGCAVERWDAALSAGKPIWILGNDDAHDVLNPMKVGRKFTMINVKSSEKNEVLNAIKVGNAYGVKYLTKVELSLEELAQKHQNIPQLQSIQIRNDTLEVISKDEPIKIVFVGQNGVRLDSIENTKTAHFKLKQDDKYIRTELTYPENTIIYLNPVLRSPNGLMPVTSKASIDVKATILLRVGYSGLVFLIVLFLLRNKRIRVKGYVRLNKRQKLRRQPDLALS